MDKIENVISIIYYTNSSPNEDYIERAINCNGSTINCCSSVSNKIITRCNFLMADSIHGERSGKARNTQTSESGAKVPRRRIDSSMSDWHVARGKKRDSWPYRCHVPTRPWPLAIRPVCDSGFFEGFTVFAINRDRSTARVQLEGWVERGR